MKIIYLPAKSEFLNIQEKLKEIKIKESFEIITTIQYLDEVKKLKGYKIAGQVLGCNTEIIKNSKAQAFLYIGTGRFHPLIIAYRTKKKVYIFDPHTSNFSQIKQEDIQNFEKRKIGAMLKYFNADKVGILVSTKPGQYNLKKALEFQKKCKKQSYIFLCNSISNLENFPDIQCWVNTACPRIFEDDLGVPIINLEDIHLK
jgi:2-(3-amino-3-carboxypropyl)histidine synthase